MLRDRYQSDGYCFPADAIPVSMAREAAQRIAALIDDPPVGMNHPWYLKAHLLFDWVYKLTTHPVVLDAVEAIIGPDILVQAADIFAKPAYSTKYINWHQDANYWNLDPFEICTAWIALTAVYPENGCMRFLPGTHKQNKIEHIETFAEDSALTRGQEITLEIDEEKAVDVILNTGEISLHHCLLAHSSGPNQTASPRIGLAIRYMSPHVRQTEGPAMSAILVRGEDKYGNYKVDLPPTTHLGTDAIRSHARSMAPHAAENYATA